MSTQEVIIIASGEKDAKKNEIMIILILVGMVFQANGYRMFRKIIRNQDDSY